MTYKENITAILECYFSGFNEEIIDSACNRILEQEQYEDVISRQAVLDILEKEGHKWGNDYRDWIDAVKDVETLPPVKPQESKLIPVSERLPEKDDLYLVYFDDGEYNLAYFSNGAFSYSGVIAWFSLPESYESQEG